MPRGPFDEEIKGPVPKDDHARKRREEFLKKRFPGGNPPGERGEPPERGEESENIENIDKDASGDR